MTTQTLGEQPVMPPADTAEMLELSRFLTNHVAPAVLLGPDGEQVALPIEVYTVLRQVAEAMEHGKAISVAPLSQQLTTQQAADLLGISRPTLVKLLDNNEISYERPAGGRHRRLRLQDVLQYRDRRRVDRRSRLAEMTRQAAEDGLYEASAADYTEALAVARHER